MPTDMDTTKTALVQNLKYLIGTTSLHMIVKGGAPLQYKYWINGGYIGTCAPKGRRKHLWTVL